MLINYFKEPSIFAIIGDVNEAKSNLIYSLITDLKANYTFNLVTFGLKYEIEGTRVINSLEQLEDTKDSLIFLDEFYSLFDLEDRKKKRQIEKSLRLIAHNNNILVLIGVPDNFKKFIAGKISTYFYKKVTLKDFVNGSSAKENLKSYEGDKIGFKKLSLDKNEVLVYDGDYKVFKIPYLEQYDSKRENVPIFVQKKGEIKNV